MAILLLKKAALLRVDIQREAIDAGFTLRDGTAFNVLFEVCVSDVGKSGTVFGPEIRERHEDRSDYCHRPGIDVCSHCVRYGIRFGGR